MKQTIKGLTICRNQSKVKPLKVASQAEVLVLDQKQALLSAESILIDFGDVFKDLRHIGTSRFVVDPSAVPVRHTSRHIPVALKREVTGKLTDLERNGIIVKKAAPTEWISNNCDSGCQKLTFWILCLDSQELNKVIQHPKYQMPSVHLMKAAADSFGHYHCLRIPLIWFKPCT